MKKRIICVLLVACMLGLFLASCTSDSFETVQVRELTWAVGTPLPTAECFVTDLPAGYSVRFAQQYTFASPADYDLMLVISNEKGKEKEQAVKLHLIIDDQPPVLTGVGDISAYLGEGIVYRSGVGYTDNCHNGVELEIDTSSVNTKQEGVYPVHYIAVDEAGNKTQQTVQLYLYERKISLEELNALLEPIVASYIPTAGSFELQARSVYQYVYNNISYSATSDKSDWIRAAYEGLRRGNGDCYTYFALSKAFFQYLGIENMDITRTPGIVLERHYWNLVNIGTREEPRWYHFDACRLQGGTITTCLLTDRQVAAYTAERAYENGVKGYFYAYDADSFPKSSERVITSTPSLGIYAEG